MSDVIDKQQAQAARKIFADPVLFARNVLGVELWERQIEILRSIEKCRRTAIKACHGVGKTFVLAQEALWWLARYEDGIVLTTSPTLRQVRTQLWIEINRAVSRSRIKFPDINKTDLTLRGDQNFALGLSTNRAENFQGYHGKAVLIIADEAPGIEAGIWDAIGGTMAGGKVHVVMAGNPTHPAGAFYDAFTRERGLWNCLSISAFDSPNLKGVSLEQLLQMDPREGGPLDDNPIPYLATKRWVYEQYFSWWHGHEQNSPQWQSRVLGEFPDQSEYSLFRMEWLERARKSSERTLPSSGSSLVAGVDVGGGRAETVVYICESGPGLNRIVTMGAWRGVDTRGQVLRFLDPYRSRLFMVYVDTIGIGHNFALHLRDNGYRVDFVNVAMPCEPKPALLHDDPARRFVNRKAQYYYKLAEDFERGQIENLTDEMTIGQLAALQYDVDSHGRIGIESKEEARKRGVPSPDRAEALMLALCKPYLKFEYFSLRNPPPGWSDDPEFRPPVTGGGSRWGRRRTIW